MLIYASSKAFPRKTFVLTAKPKHSIARARAQIMHILYELGREDHQFRLRFNGQYLKDSLTIDDYDIMDNAVLKMVPMAKDHDSLLDLQSIVSESSNDTSLGGALSDAKFALLKEVLILNRRQTMTAVFHGLLSMHFLGVILSIVSSYWYTSFYHLLIYIVSSYYAPNYSRLSGFTGNYAITPKVYCWIFSVLYVIICGVSATLSTLKWISIVNHGCPGWVFVDDCSHHNVYTAIFFGIHSLTFIMTAILLWVMVANFKFEAGDVIEKLLIQTRDLNKILQSSKSGKVKERRMAAFELASMAATSDDNKFLIVAENGLDSLISLSLTEDLGTQEYAAEALAELLTVPQIQDKFVEIGGVRHLTALLHSRSERCIQEAMTAISYIVQDSQHNKHAIIADQGLDDLSRAAYHSNIVTQRLLSGIFLELVFAKEIRDELASMNTPAQALIHLCRLDDAEAQGFALQSLELLAIESPETICAQHELLPILLTVPHQTVDPKRQTLAAKLLLYYCEQRESCEQVLAHPSLYDSLMLFSKISHAILQKVIVKIVSCMTGHTDMRIQALSHNLDQVLLQIKHNAADREAWNMADTGIQMMQSADNLSHLPVLSTADKISRMHSHSESRPGSIQGSLTSLRSKDGEAAGSSAGSQRSMR